MAEPDEQTPKGCFALVWLDWLKECRIRTNDESKIEANNWRAAKKKTCIE